MRAMTTWVRILLFCSSALLTHVGHCAEVALNQFGRNAAWLALRNVPADKVVALLGVGDVRSTDWRSGIDAAVYAAPHETRSLRELREKGYPYPETDLVFISPAVNGWTLAASQQLAYMQSFMFPRIPAARYPDKVIEFVQRLSRDADAEVQYFLSFEAPETHIWILADHGKIVRAHGFSGENIEVMFNVGERTQAERDLGMNYAPNSDQLFKNGFDKIPTSQDLLSLAGRWSVDPSSIDSKYNKERGWIGVLRTESNSRRTKQTP